MTRIGIFGGTFDPFHFGHLNSMLDVAEQYGLDKVKAIPTCVSPLRVQTQGSTAEQRGEMVRRGIKGHEDVLEVDERELKRGGVSYTVETLEAIAKEDPSAQLFLIIGMDQFNKFDEWKHFDRILALADLVVTSRPGMELPHTLEDWPPGLRPLVDDYDAQQGMLKSGKTIYFFKLKEVEASGTEIRKKVRFEQSVMTLVPSGVDEYIRDNKLYESVNRNIGDFEKFSTYCKKILVDKGGINVEIYDLRDRDMPSEFTVICSGTSTRHATALAEHLIREIKKDYNVWPESIEGQREGRWIVVDYGALIVHSFYDFVRQEYRLEDLWTKKPKQK